MHCALWRNYTEWIVTAIITCPFYFFTLEAWCAFLQYYLYLTVFEPYYVTQYDTCRKPFIPVHWWGLVTLTYIRLLLKCMNQSCVLYPVLCLAFHLVLRKPTFFNNVGNILLWLSARNCGFCTTTGLHCCSCCEITFMDVMICFPSLNHASFDQCIE